MPRNSHILYSGDEAEFLSRLQELWKPGEDKKAEVIFRHLGGAESLLDLGCGPGQLLKRLAGKVSRLAGDDLQLPGAKFSAYRAGLTQHRSDVFVDLH